MSVNTEEKRKLYQLIAAQLRDDGFHSLVSELEKQAQVLIPKRVEKDHLLRSVHQGGVPQQNTTHTGPLKPISLDGLAPPPAPSQKSTLSTSNDTPLDFAESSGRAVGGNSKKRPQYETKFITTHKNIVRCAQFSPDGLFVATASEDSSLKVLDVEKLKDYNQMKNDPSFFEAHRPVTRTFYDHTDSIYDIDFYPHADRILASGSRDCRIHFYDVSSPNAKRGFGFIQDSHPVRSINFHPAGEYILVATAHPLIRLYNIDSKKAYVCSNSADQHLGTINQVRYTTDGSMFASCGKDGFLRLWDGKSNKMVKYVAHAHAGYEVSSVQFSKNGRYLLSSGKDSIVRLWDIRTGKQVKKYTGAFQSKARVNTTFTHDEAYIISPDESQSSVVVWNARTGDMVERLTGHNNMVRAVATSPTEFSLMTCSVDFRARYWFGNQKSSSTTTFSVDT